MRSSVLAASLVLSPMAMAQDASSEAPEASAPASPVTYAIQPSASDLYVIIRNDTSALASRLGHDHVIYADDFQGEVTWPSAEGQACNVAFSVPVMSLVVDPPGLRARAGLDDNTIDQGDKESLKKNMWGKSQLEASSYTHVTFKASKCAGTEGKVKVDGTMTVRGTEAPVSIALNITHDGSQFRAKGAVDLSHSAFGFKPFAATAFGPRNQDRLTFVVNVKGSAK